MDRFLLDRVCSWAFADELAKIARAGGGHTFAVPINLLPSVTSKAQELKQKLQEAAKRVRLPAVGAK